MQDDLAAVHAEAAAESESIHEAQCIKVPDADDGSKTCDNCGNLTGDEIVVCPDVRDICLACFG